MIVGALQDVKFGDSKFLDFIKSDENNYDTAEGRMVLYPIIDVLSPGQRGMLSYTNFSNMVIAGTLDEGLMLSFDTIDKRVAIDGSAWNTTYATAVFYDKNYNILFERIYDNPSVGENFKGVFKLGENEYFLYTEFDCIDLTIEEMPEICKHEYVDTVIETSKESCGYTEHVCSKCGDTYRDGFKAELPILCGTVNTIGEEESKGITVKLTDANGRETNAEVRSNGVFNLSSLPAGNYTVTVKKQGYAPVIKHITVKPNSPLDISFDLYRYGDANNDGKVNIKDLVLLQRKLNKWSIKIDKSVCDMNKDGKVNIKDLILLRRLLNKWKIEFD